MSAREEEAVEELLLRVVPGLAAQWKGASPASLEQIEKIAGRPLPTFYRWFLSRMGQRMGPLAYPTLDFSAQRILDCYAKGWVEPHPRLLLIAHDSNGMMPMPLFYDLDAPARGDALVASKEEGADEDDLYEKFETLREMLAWGALAKFRVGTMPQACNGTFSGDEPNLLAVIAPVMSSLGFKQPIPTGPYCGIYERDDAAMICMGMPRHGVDKARSFELGGTTAGVLRKVLGEVVAASSLKLRVDEWVPALV
ncbi:SMI1/KNR4 family protein [Myxococcus sp. CA056]|uniref:SMI1/KNR4 family protein n=1 Tax=unclassified Myxococcus TaxID=2648731 RepID=UPI00157B0314|nr:MULTISPECIES: SMI1/KNR4 family protein [unclassified Myxococcus]NTX10176.1 SMI1/KNR4 family protein [Myxococcus sp. CA056]NTX41502.1 SMI1/KNR4 family protein [Myxococcus sp. CA033]NTX51029.1 SMI1/KNR4 family protein [Myxococcus sp. CA039A]